MAAPNISDVEKKLDTLYATDLKEYIEHVKTVRDVGYKVFRNANGKHKIKYNEDYSNEENRL